ncbi:MAG TPA: hypothetical protein VJT49_21055 [Amycolatopsis sp.]|uniref:hypothetical protein n=1 Tax=Amycolatopsis sp. TaxID=37632 RepID=UPI002B4A13D1|nr:hypothetical protein [Amycolatopsis sp.]HKS47551.1 hypothetical protein [Amycolatopsis sp.]
MDAEIIVVIAAAIIAAGAAGVAIWQAREAAKSRAAAERQARAAVESVTEMRKQIEALEHERAARDEQEGPRFTIGQTRGSGIRHYFEVTMIEGPEVDVTVAEVLGSNALTSRSTPRMTMPDPAAWFKERKPSSS